jgi:hypothetical protein
MIEAHFSLSHDRDFLLCHIPGTPAESPIAPSYLLNEHNLTQPVAEAVMFWK